MAPAVYRRGRGRRQPLAPASPAAQDSSRLVLEMTEIFNRSQYQGSTESALEDLKKLYERSESRQFQIALKGRVRKMLHSKPTIFFKTACSFLCKFLQHLSKESDEAKKLTGSPRNKRIRPKQPKKMPRKKRTKRDDSESEDEITAGLFKKNNKQCSSASESTSDDDSMNDSCADSQQSALITDQDRLISSCVDIADMLMQATDEDCRSNAVFFICRFLSHVESLDEEVCNALKRTLPMRIRDKKPVIRAQAVLASRTFQGEKLIQEAFRFHFQRDPELIVRKALLQIMDTKVFNYDFLVESTQDSHEIMRKAAYQRLNKLSPKDLDSNQLHCTIHNGLNERNPQAAHRFRTQTLWPWLSTLYDGLDLHKMLEPFDVVTYTEDTSCLLDNVYEHDRLQPQNNGATTQLHCVVENFRKRWLGDNCLPNIEKVDEKLVLIWFSLIKYCKLNRPVISSVRVRDVRSQEVDPNESLEHILESQENMDECVIELYERLCPDLVNLVDFLSQYIKFVEKQLETEQINSDKAEFIYLQIMDFISTYEVGDELERKTVQEVFDMLLRESLLVRYINDFIPPIIKCLYKLVYSRSSNLMVNYISELIQNVRSHLEDIESIDTASRPNTIFKNHPQELIKSLQMYLGCLQNVRITQVPPTMKTHLSELSYESLEPWYNGNSKIRCLMVACNGVTGMVDKNHIENDESTCMELLVAACFDKGTPGLQTVGFKCLVDLVCHHDDIELPERGERFLRTHMKLDERYAKEKLVGDMIDFITALIEGTAKLLYLQKLRSPEILAQLIIWWYYPMTPSKLRQFIGVFLPVFVDDLGPDISDILVDTFVPCVEALHDFILGPGYNIMAAPDITNCTNFLCKLIPVSLHAKIAERIQDKISELGEDRHDLAKYLQIPSLINQLTSTS